MFATVTDWHAGCVRAGAAVMLTAAAMVAPPAWVLAGFTEPSAGIPASPSG